MFCRCGHLVCCNYSPPYREGLGVGLLLLFPQSTLFTIPKNLYGMYLKGRSSHVGVVTTALWCENTRNDSLP